MIARCSKCDFWNLWKIWDRNRYSKKIGRQNFRRKKIRKNFGRKKFRDQKSKHLWSQKKFDQKFSDFFRRKNVRPIFFEYLFRSQIFQRFQKSYLEQRAIILKIRTARTKKKFDFLKQILTSDPLHMDRISWKPVASLQPGDQEQPSRVHKQDEERAQRIPA